MYATSIDLRWCIFEFPKISTLGLCRISDSPPKMCDGAAADNCPVFSASEDFLLKNKGCNINNPQEVT